MAAYISASRHAASTLLARAANVSASRTAAQASSSSVITSSLRSASSSSSFSAFSPVITSPLRSASSSSSFSAVSPSLIPSSSSSSSSLRRSFASKSDSDIVPKNIVQHPYTTGGKKYLPGFSFPAPRKLEDVIKYALLERETPARIQEIWNTFHDVRVDSVATTWSPEEYSAILARARKCPRFLYPVLKGDGKYFTLIAEWQDKYCIFTFLDDYRRNPAAAEPYLSVAVYDDFLTRKGLALVRGDFSGHLTKRDATHLLNLMRQFYLHEPRHLETFTKDPSSFDWNAYVRECPPPPPIGSKNQTEVKRDTSVRLPSTGSGIIV